ncbi:MAG: recombinase RecJ [Candidatus Bathyarchaeota archaeon B23]|nr:MAG: recombinase RecJ [Candidatus Bathyarchaeota archaeon B23]
MESFLSSFKSAVELLRRHGERGDQIRIVTHSDADGIAAGGALTLTAMRLGVPFKASCEKRFHEGLMEELASEEPPLVIFSDIGSGYLDMVEGRLPKSDVVVLDHHKPIKAEAEGVVHINPLLHDLDGSREVSAAGLAYLLAEMLDEGNRDLSVLGIIGALGDQQDKGERRSLLGLNTRIEASAKEAGLLETGVDLIFYGYETRPLAKAIAYTTTPFIPGLSGREDSCVAFLKEVGIELKRGGRWRALRDLSEEEKRRLFSSLSKHLVHEGCSSEMVHELIGTIYTIKGEERGTSMRDGREYASLLNACARMERPGLGLSLCLGDRGSALREAEETLDLYRRRIAEYLDLVREEGRIEELGNIYVLRGRDEVDDRLIGVVASILLSTGMLKSPKPIIAWASSDDGLIKVSARATEAMAREGIHLGAVMMEAAERFQGRGGGHDIAAGAYIPEELEASFIELVDKLIGEQRHGGGED